MQNLKDLYEKSKLRNEKKQTPLPPHPAIQIQQTTVEQPAPSFRQGRGLAPSIETSVEQPVEVAVEPPQQSAPVSNIEDRLLKVENAIDKCQKSKISSEYNAFILKYNDAMQQFSDIIVDLSSRLGNLEN